VLIPCFVVEASLARKNDEGEGEQGHQPIHTRAPQKGTWAKRFAAPFKS
jgi:hypothetical protein